MDWTKVSLWLGALTGLVFGIISGYFMTSDNPIPVWGMAVIIVGHIITFCGMLMWRKNP